MFQLYVNMLKGSELASDRLCNAAWSCATSGIRGSFESPIPWAATHFVSASLGLHSSQCASWMLLNQSTTNLIYWFLCCPLLDASWCYLYVETALWHWIHRGESIITDPQTKRLCTCLKEFWPSQQHVELTCPSPNTNVSSYPYRSWPPQMGSEQGSWVAACWTVAVPKINEDHMLHRYY